MKLTIIFFLCFFPAAHMLGQHKNTDLLASRTISKEGDGHRIEITIRSKEKIRGYVKIMETIPENYVARKVKLSGADFSYSGNKVKLIWINFPSEDEIKVIYFLNWTGNVDANHEVLKYISGEFSYMASQQIKKAAIVTVNNEALGEKNGVKLVPVQDN